MRPYHLPHRRALLGGVLILSAATTAYAGGVAGIVFDPSNYVENLATAIQTLNALSNQANMIANQINSLANQAVSLTNQARNLTQLPYSIKAQFSADMANLQTLIDQTRGFAVNFQTMQTAFQTTYPNFGATARGITANQYAAQITTWGQNAEQAIGNTMKGATQNATYANNDTKELTTISTLSQSGNLSAVETGNQLAELTAKEIRELQVITTQAATAEDSYLQQQETNAAVERNVDKNFYYFAPMTVPTHGPGIPHLP